MPRFTRTLSSLGAAAAVLAGTALATPTAHATDTSRCVAIDSSSGRCFAPNGNPSIHNRILDTKVLYNKDHYPSTTATCSYSTSITVDRSTTHTFGAQMEGQLWAAANLKLQGSYSYSVHKTQSSTEASSMSQTITLKKGEKAYCHRYVEESTVPMRTWTYSSGGGTVSYFTARGPRVIGIGISHSATSI